MGDHISVRRTRIAEKLAERGIEADIRDTSGLDALAAVRTAIEGDYDVILGNVRVGLYLGYPLARLLGTPFVGDVSDPLSDFEDLPWPLFRLLSAYEWFVLGHADACAFTYDETKAEADRRGIEGQKLPNAVDYDFFADPDPEAVAEAVEILDAEGVDRSKPIAVYIGGMIEETYHLTDIVDAAERRPDWEFVFVGDGPQRDVVVDAAAELDNVHFPGAFDYRLMPGFLAHATAGFCLKDAEQPLKIAEYGAAGLVGVVQPGDLSERFADDEVLVSDPTGEALAAALATLDDESVRETYAENLRDRAKSVGWDDVAAEYDRTIRRVARE
ncbi:glycosyltransferase [Haloarcula litorea]|uniref:glycosyltransferase n=1 Tax=Haloarcula litorea TaxID=3032579 RepID=UPI0023E7BD7E|nr:glycosyltransferase [Halomicroarcula sp. GDY20]